ncbi:MAG: heme NO-binding domain-containing protein [Candidatus Hodarchaeales archaeon]
MKGVIINILENFISEKFSDEILDEMYEKVNLSEGVPPFVGPISYPDKDVVNILDFLSKKTDLSIEKLLYTFGIYTIPVFAKKYPGFFENKPSAKDFLSSINDIVHVEVKKLYDDAFTPLLKLEKTDDDRIFLHYQSTRKLCDFLEGLIDGVADKYGEKITYHHIQCMKEGADECILELTFK